MKVLKGAKTRTESDRTKLRQTVSEIIDNVRQNGDAALIQYNSRFDQCDRPFLQISREEIKEDYEQV